LIAAKIHGRGSELSVEAKPFRNTVIGGREMTLWVGSNRLTREISFHRAIAL
jgi:hypothetical protein